MRALTITIAILLVAVFCNAQVKLASIPISAQGDTSLWYIWQQKDFKKANLPNLAVCTDSLHIRFATETQAIDIWTADYKLFYGTISNFTYREKTGNNEAPVKFYSNINTISPDTAALAYGIFNNLSIAGIATDDSIKGWNAGFDGDEYIIDYSTPTRYSFKTYWTPSAYKNTLKEAALIDSLVHQYNALINMPQSFNMFINTLPIGCYKAGSIYMICTQAHKKG